MALGAYDITPLEAAGAYTIFANDGDYVKPSFLSLVRAQDGKVVYKNKVESKRELDPRVSYLVTNLMEEVLRSGTGATCGRAITSPCRRPARPARRATAGSPASRANCCASCGWGSTIIANWTWKARKSAAPIWGEFMKRALEFREYRDAKPFHAPSGIVSIEIDPDTGYAATVSCPRRQTEVYIAGTEPVTACPVHGGRPGITTIAGWDAQAPASTAPPANTAPTFTGTGGDGSAVPESAARRAARQAAGAPSVATDAPPPPPPGSPRRNQKRRGFSSASWVCLNNKQGGEYGLPISVHYPRGRFGGRHRFRTTSLKTARPCWTRRVERRRQPKQPSPSRLPPNSAAIS